MRVKPVMFVVGGLMAGAVALAAAQGGQQAQAPAAPDFAQVLVDRLSLDRYKATIKGLTQFGDRREGTQRNRDAVAWIEAQLKSYGCPTERMEYVVAARGGGGGQAAAGGATGAAAGAGATTGGAARAGGQGAAGAAGAGAGAAGAGAATGGGQTGRGQGAPATVLTQPNRRGTGGSTYYGITRPTGVNNRPENQPDEKLRALNSGPVLPDPIPQVFCTKVGTTRPNEVYIIGGHMDGIGYGEAANDDASGSAIVMELARVFSSPDVTTDVTIRFALWNGEEGGLRGAGAYVAQRQDMQGKEVPAGSGKYPEPKWLGMIQHDMMMWDHGMPRADGTLNPEQRPEADFNIEFQMTAKQSEGAMKLAWAVKAAADKYSKNYPGTVGPHMTNTDSGPFMDIVPAISMRENERGMHTGAGWNPHWHQPTDLFTTFSDKDFTLGLNSAQATLGAIATLSGAKVK
jgi:hypothetical protein